jgi:hypothetical protein
LKRSSIVEAVEQVSRTTAEAINHGVEHFGPILIHVPVVNAITDVLRSTITLLADLVETGTNSWR